MNCNQLLLLCHAHRGSTPSDEKLRGNYESDLAYLVGRGLVTVTCGGDLKSTDRGRALITTCLNLKEVVIFKVSEDD